MITYIIETNENEFYCGKTNNIDRRLKEHLKEKIPHWFGFKDRKNIRHVIYISGDMEKKIKKFGIRNLWRFMGGYSIRRLPP